MPDEKRETQKRLLSAVTRVIEAYRLREAVDFDEQYNLADRKLNEALSALRSLSLEQAQVKASWHGEVVVTRGNLQSIEKRGHNQGCPACRAMDCKHKPDCWIGQALIPKPLEPAHPPTHRD